MTNAQKAIALRKVMDLLEQADSLQQRTLGDSDVAMCNHHKIEELLEDLMYDIIELELEKDVL